MSLATGPCAGGPSQPVLVISCHPWDPRQANPGSRVSMTSQEKTTAKCSEQRRPPRGGPHCTARLCPQGPRPGGCGLAPAGQKHALLLDTARSARSSPARDAPRPPFCRLAGPLPRAAGQGPACARLSPDASRPRSQERGEQCVSLPSSGARSHVPPAWPGWRTRCPRPASRWCPASRGRAVSGRQGGVLLRPSPPGSRELPQRGGHQADP